MRSGNAGVALTEELVSGSPATGPPSIWQHMRRWSGGSGRSTSSPSHGHLGRSGGGRQCQHTRGRRIWAPYLPAVGAWDGGEADGSASTRVAVGFGRRIFRPWAPGTEEGRRAAVAVAARTRTKELGDTSSGHERIGIVSW
jgi:hypothetical protein